jgi:hypothetical protein
MKRERERERKEEANTRGWIEEVSLFLHHFISLIVLLVHVLPKPRIALYIVIVGKTLIEVSINI